MSCVDSSSAVTLRISSRPTNQELVNRLKNYYENVGAWSFSGSYPRWQWGQNVINQNYLPNSNSKDISLWPKYAKNREEYSVMPYELWSFCNHFFANKTPSDIERDDTLCCLMYLYFAVDKNKIISMENLVDPVIKKKVQEEFVLSEKLKKKTAALISKFEAKYELLKRKQNQSKKNEENPRTTSLSLSGVSNFATILRNSPMVVVERSQTGSGSHRTGSTDSGAANHNQSELSYSIDLRDILPKKRIRKVREVTVDGKKAIEIVEDNQFPDMDYSLLFKTDTEFGDALMKAPKYNQRWSQEEKLRSGPIIHAKDLDNFLKSLN